MKVPAAVSTTIAFLSYAKINLYLQVLGRRDDGYHNIETIYQTVDLSDELHFSLRPSEVTLECASQALGGPEDNLAWKAAALLKERCDCDKGVHIELIKRIPVAAGLAGGSGNAAATLTGLNQLWGLGLSELEVREIGLELGSDVPYCTVGGTIAAIGRGERLTPLEPLSETAFVLVHSPTQVSTARVYGHPLLPKSKEEPIGDMTPSFKLSIGELQRGAIPDMLYNAMEDVVFAEHPELAVLKQHLLDAGCAGALMSGSGPTLFGLCRDRDHAREVAAGFNEVDTSVVASVPHGVQRLS